MMQSGPRTTLTFSGIFVTAAPWAAIAASSGAITGPSLTWIKFPRLPAISATWLIIEGNPACSGLAESGKRGAIAQFDPVRAWNVDDALALERRHHPAHGLD